MKNFNLNQAAEIVAQYNDAIVRLDSDIMPLISGNNKLARNMVFGQSSYTDRCEVSPIKMRAAFINRLRHDTWSIVFEGSDVWTRYPTSRNDERLNMIKHYMLTDRFNKDEFYTKDVKELRDVTVQSIEAFFSEYMADSIESDKKVIGAFLGHCGASWKTQPSELKNKMTFRATGFSDYERLNELACVLNIYFRLVEGEARKHNDIYAVINANRAHCNVDLFDGLLNWTRNANGNVTLKLSADLVQRLNAIVNA